MHWRVSSSASGPAGDGEAPLMSSSIFLWRLSALSFSACTCFSRPPFALPSVPCFQGAALLAPPPGG
eukprot:12982229-Heterocapsa_arctica.AAC.1